MILPVKRLQLAVFAMGVAFATSAFAQPDPRAMSGIARVDGAVAPGTIIVRVLLGTFQQPAIGQKVSLELVGPGGEGLVERDAVTDDQGRATFDGLSQWIGGKAVLRTDFDGEPVASQLVALSASGGSRLLLVKGAGTPAGAQDHGQPSSGSLPSAGHPQNGGPTPGAVAAGAPAWCRPEAIDSRQAGEIVVGVADFDGQGGLKPYPNVEVKLIAEFQGPSGRERKEQVARADVEGRAVFVELGEPNYPASTRFWAEAKIEIPEDTPRPMDFGRVSRTPELGKGVVELAVARPGEPVLRSIPFELAGKAWALPLGKACSFSVPQPIADSNVTLWQQSKTGDRTSQTKKTDERGVVRFSELPEKTLLWAVAQYEGAPFESSYFDLDAGVGVTGEVPVWPVTDDVSKIVSAAQFEVMGSEADHAQVNRRHELMVQGSKAFWPRGGMLFFADERAKSLTLLPGVDEYLEHAEGEPFARLKKPLEPGKVTDLSMAYMVPHHGALELEWNSPFPLVKALAVVEDPIQLVRGATGPAKRSEHAGSESAQMYELVAQESRAGYCRLLADQGFACPNLLQGIGGSIVSFELRGLKTVPNWPVRLALGLTAGLVAALIAAFAIPRKRNLAAQLEERRRLLEERLATFAANGRSADQLARSSVAKQLDITYRQIEALHAESASESKTR